MIARDRVALRRCARAAEPLPARLRRRWPAPAFRSTATRPRAALGFDGPTAQLARCGQRPRLRARLSDRRRRSARCTFAAGRGVRAVGVAAVRLRRAVATNGRPAARSCRRSATPTPPSWCAAIRGRIVGCLTALMVTMKGLPLAYSKDMQDDKPPVFEAHDLLGAVDRGDDRHGRERDVPHRPDARAGGEPASPPRPTSPTGWCARRACRSARRTTSPAAR